MIIRNGGWMKVHRKLWDEYLDYETRNCLWGDCNTFFLYLTLLVHSNIKESSKVMECFGRTIKRGEIWVIMDKIASLTGLEKHVLERCLKKLVKNQMVEIERSPKGRRFGRVIKIVNYDSYINTDDEIISEESKDELKNDQEKISKSRGDRVIKREEKVETEKKEEYNISQNGNSASLGPLQSALKNLMSKKKPKPKPTEQTLGSKIWDSYRDAYQNRYGQEPVRNARVNSLCKKIGESLGQDGIEVTKFYVERCPDKWIIKQFHPLGDLLAHVQRHHSCWKQGFYYTQWQVNDMSSWQGFQETSVSKPYSDSGLFDFDEPKEKVLSPGDVICELMSRDEYGVFLHRGEIPERLASHEDAIAYKKMLAERK